MVVTPYMVTNYSKIITGIALAIGITVIIVVALATVVAALWGVSFCLILLLSHVTQLQLVLILVIGYEGHKFAKRVAYGKVR